MNNENKVPTEHARVVIVTLIAYRFDITQEAVSDILEFAQSIIRVTYPELDEDEVLLVASDDTITSLSLYASGGFHGSAN